MKRSGPLRRVTPLRSETGLSRGGSGLRRTTRVNPVSPRRAKLNRTRAAFVKRILAERPFCEACPVLHGRRVRPRDAVDVHELVRRSQWLDGIIVPENVLAVCRRCHDWITDAGDAAVNAGLALPEHARRNPEMFGGAANIRVFWGSCSHGFLDG